MQDKIQEKKEIIGHYKYSAAIGGGGIGAGDEMHKLISDNEHEIAKYGMMLKE
jgi:hypothetical protein